MKKRGLAIELDGGQHLADADAYRRDRRKDQLLQENGYFVLRFLAEDVGKNLDLVLDGDPAGAGTSAEAVMASSCPSGAGICSWLLTGTS